LDLTVLEILFDGRGKKRWEDGWGEKECFDHRSTKKMKGGGTDFYNSSNFQESFVKRKVSGVP